jgi:hypothetical protein
MRWCAVGLIGLAIGLSACGGSEAPESFTPSPESPIGGSPTTPAGSAADALQSGADIQVLWQGGPHAATYVLDDAGENSQCARCHAPVNWVPSMDDMPESCATCKFEVEPPPPVIPEAEWTHVECKVCHDEDESGPSLAWLEIAAIGEYTEVATVTALCDKCHLAGDVAGHASVVVAGDHAGTECTECHDPHMAAPSCESESCHAGILDASLEIPGHDAAHAGVGCPACHDASGMNVGPAPDGGAWTTFLSSPEGGPSVGFASHNTQRAAACDRCHFDGNSWGLSAPVPSP